ncbi:hypothetical protein P3T51_06075 [Weissella confusa]|uniref:hypothetical protein n=1 Tax=Weissella confusa TaxID=1583 RepID=UPI0024078A65|nr:hypothetical protein [Weissella confusa]WEY49285.1 hypothetical protein P3T51_06075 [Weissella confusa]
MAKWKNIALISTIVAPIAFGVGDAFAQANRPTNDSDGTTVILHKRETQGAEIADKDSETLYWGMEIKMSLVASLHGSGNQG